jgi:hypothetical protein
MSITHKATRLAVAGGIAAAAVAGALVSATPVVAAGPHPTPPGQSTAKRATTSTVNPAANGPSRCVGGTNHGVVVKTDDTPLYWNSGTKTVSQTVTTTRAQGSETLVITFSGEAYAENSLAWIQADVSVDGTFAEPYDTGSPNAFTSGAHYTNASLTRCIRVRPGTHTVKVILTPIGTGYAWVDDYALRIDKYN